MESLFLTGHFDLIDFLLNLVFGTTDWIFVAAKALFIAGLWQMFRKSGIEGWWALIPGAREYQMGRCGGREPEGRRLCVFTVLDVLINIFGTGPIILLSRSAMDQEMATIAIGVLNLAVSLTVFFYSIRVFSGLTELYGLRKRWIILWILPAVDCLPPLIWGFSKKYQPAWKVEDIKAALEQLATHGSSTVLDEGLSVNLKERSATEFFQKKYCCATST